MNLNILGLYYLKYTLIQLQFNTSTLRLNIFKISVLIAKLTGHCKIFFQNFYCGLLKSFLKEMLQVKSFY